jgi:hypothetical protein
VDKLALREASVEEIAEPLPQIVRVPQRPLRIGAVGLDVGLMVGSSPDTFWRPPPNSTRPAKSLLFLAELPPLAGWLLALGMAASAVAAPPSTTAMAVASSNIIFLDTLPPELVEEGGQEAPSCTLTRSRVATLGTQPTLSVRSAYRPNVLVFY